MARAVRPVDDRSRHAENLPKHFHSKRTTTYIRVEQDKQ